MAMIVIWHHHCHHCHHCHTRHALPLLSASDAENRIPNHALVMSIGKTVNGLDIHGIVLSKGQPSISHRGLTARLAPELTSPCCLDTNDRRRYDGKAEMLPAVLLVGGLQGNHVSLLDCQSYLWLDGFPSCLRLVGFQSCLRLRST